MALVYDDRRFAAVLAELTRSGWLLEQRNRLREVCDAVWQRALVVSSRADSAMSALST